MGLQPENTDGYYSLEPRYPFLGLLPAIDVRMAPLGRFVIVKHPEQVMISCLNQDPGDWIQNIRIRYREWKED